MGTFAMAIGLSLFYIIPSSLPPSLPRFSTCQMVLADLDGAEIRDGDLDVTELEGDDLENTKSKNNTKLTVLQKGSDAVTGMVHESLTRIPRPPGCCMAVFILLGTVAFVIVMTLYGLGNCSRFISVVDAEWPAIDNWEPYKDAFKAPSHVCGSFIQSLKDEDGSSLTYEDGTLVYPEEREEVKKLNNLTGVYPAVYDIPCFLNGLTCDDYQDPRCPSIFEGVRPGKLNCSSIFLTNCSGQSLASVVTIECKSFFVAFGVAMSDTVWIQLALLILFLSCFHGCCQSKHDHGHDQSISEIIRASIAKK
jgi:hypothetical protein